MEARCRCRIIGIADKVSGEYSGRRAWWRRFRTTVIDMAAEEIWDGNRWDVGRRIWRNELEGRRQTGKILIGNDYQPKNLLSLQNNGDGRQGQRWIQQWTSMVAEMRDNRDLYGGGGDTGQKRKRCGTTEMAKWVGRTATYWANIYRERLPTWGRIVAPIT